MLHASRFLKNCLFRRDIFAYGYKHTIQIIISLSKTEQCMAREIFIHNSRFLKIRLSIEDFIGNDNYEVSYLDQNKRHHYAPLSIQ